MGHSETLSFLPLFAFSPFVWFLDFGLAPVYTPSLQRLDGEEFILCLFFSRSLPSSIDPSPRKEMAAKPADTRPVVETVLLYLSRILYRIRLLTLFAFAAVSLCWLYWDSGVNSVSQLYNGFASTKGRGSWGDNWTQSEWAAPRRSHLIPPKIWQIMLPKGQDQRTAVSPDALKETATWLGMNPGYA